MRTLIMCQGLPGSGKSTWASGEADRAYRDPTLPWVVVVNKDEIRRELGGEWSKELETTTVSIRDQRIMQALSHFPDVTVISDDTNFARQHKVRLNELARMYGAQFKIKKFELPIEECIKRVQRRTSQAAVPEQVIRDMAKKYHVGVPTTYPDAAPVPTEGPNGEPLMLAIICDLDGTLSLLNGRSPYDASTCDQDLINESVRNLLEVYYRTQFYQILYLSGREEKYRPQTGTFMRKHHCPPGGLFMRQTGDFRKDWVVKGELFDAHVRGRYRVKFVLDDRNQVVNYWRHLGLTCFQVAPGAF